MYGPDASILLQELKCNGLERDTLVMFSSDNGPWYQGSAGKLRGRKTTTYEGGVHYRQSPWTESISGRC
jgi:arylsulfatase A-like enzyme